MRSIKLRASAALTGAALLAVVVGGSFAGTTAVSEDLTARADQVLAVNGLDGVDVRFDGREGRLRRGSRVDLAEARALVADLRGVRQVRVTAAAARRPDSPGDGRTVVPTLSLRRSDGSVRVKGAVPSAKASADIKAAAAEAFGGTVAGDVAVDVAVGPATWAAAVPGLLPALVDVSDLRLMIDGSGTVQVSGTTSTTGARVAAVAAVRTAFPELDVIDGTAAGG